MKHSPIRAASAIPLAAYHYREVLKLERDALSACLAAPAEAVPAIVEAIATADRAIALIGVGKSGLVAAKAAATFSSLGTPAFFVNAAEAAHGDLGAVQPGTLVIAFSNSGSTDEIVRIVPLLKARRCTIIGIIGRADSPLSAAADHVLSAEVKREADHIGMAPTASTIVQMAIADALAVAVSRSRKFTRDDFLGHHPAGLLGRHAIPVRQLMRKGDAVPRVGPSASIAALIGAISGKRMGAACVCDLEGRLLGLVVDGDIRRLIEAKADLYGVSAAEIMQPKPVTIVEDAVVADVLALLQGRRLSVLPVVTPDGHLAGLLDTFELMR